MHLTQRIWSVVLRTGVGSALVLIGMLTSSEATAQVCRTFLNCSFESPHLNSSYQYDPPAGTTSWIFAAGSGVQGNGSAFHAATAPDGTQAAFIQGQGSMTQAVSLAPGSYTLTLMAARRPEGCCSNPLIQPVMLTVDGIQVGNLISPASTNWQSFSIPVTIATSGPHTFTFTGTINADMTTFIDRVSIASGGGGGGASPTSTALVGSPNPATVGQAVTFTATVTGSAPSGTVSFTADGAAIAGCSAVTLTTSSATCATGALAQGVRSIVAAYSGDAANAPSTSPAFSEQINATGGGTPGTLVVNQNGGNNAALGDWSLAGGLGSTTGPGANGAFAWGQGAQATGGGAFALGRGAKAAYTDTFAWGTGVEAHADNGWAMGWRSLSTGKQGFAHGFQANDRGIDGLEAFAHGSFVNNNDVGLGVADAQTSRAPLRMLTTNATPTPLTTDGAGFSFNNQLRMPDQSSYIIQWLVIARNSATGDSKAWRVVAMATRGLGAATTIVYPPEITIISSSANTAAWSVATAADGYNGAVQLVVTGEAGKTVKWFAVAIDGEVVN
jgi:hypothetical protein